GGFVKRWIVHPTTFWLLKTVMRKEPATGVMSEMKQAYTIKPQTAVASPDSSTTDLVFPIELVAPVVGMAHSFIRRVLGRKSILSEADVRQLLDQDAFSETFVPRSRVLEYLRRAVTGAVLVAESQEVI